MMDFIANLSVAELTGRIAMIFVILSTVVQISPINVNPWSWIARKIGAAMNHDAMEKIDDIGVELARLCFTVDENSAKASRERILGFGDELIYYPERKHSKDQFDNVAQHITEYNAYCKEHPEFKNNMTETTTQLILSTYERCMKEHDFL